MNSTTVHIINTPGDDALFDRVNAQLDRVSGFDVNRIEGVLGRTLPDVLCLKLTRDPNSLMNKGALGCFLSHISAWEAVVKSKNEFCVILEDDVELSDVSLLHGTDLPDGFDIIFINDRTSHSTPTSSQLEFFPIESALNRIEQHRMSVGGDGYILSAQGAEKLISAVNRDLFFSHVDLRMLAYCLKEDERFIAEPNGPLSRDLKNIVSITKSSRLLTGHCTNLPIVRHTSIPSRRVREDRIGSPTPREA